jgi:hypothetical protein
MKNSRIVTVNDARRADFDRKEARIDALQRKAKNTNGMSDADAQSLAAATDPRIGVLLRLGRSHRSFPIFYAVIGDPFHGETVESRDISDIVRALSEGGAA